MNILLVEDNPADVRLVREAMAEHALEVQLHWVASGDEALAYVRRQAPYREAAEPDLVLLDLNLPGTSGHEVLKAIKSDARTLHIPVVVLTTSTARADVVQAYAAHVNAYVVKPGDFDAFILLVERIRAYWMQAVLLPSQVA